MRNPARLGKADSTQPAMIDWLESQEHVVQDLHTVGGGCPDLLVGTTWGELVLVECKSPGGRLTTEQTRWHWKWHHLPRCMPKSVVELRAWMERRMKLKTQRGYIDFTVLLWAGLIAGLLLGACGFCVGSYVVRHVDVSVDVK